MTTDVTSPKPSRATVPLIEPGKISSSCMSIPVITCPVETTTFVQGSPK